MADIHRFEKYLLHEQVKILLGRKIKCNAYHTVESVARFTYAVSYRVYAQRMITSSFLAKETVALFTGRSISRRNSSVCLGS